ncbi:family of serine hydrolases 3-like isoform X2 [Cicer arietinum]|uniref:family of serine hydrolases 3-like isoform X2 n=1 Tax=Cicer arietinum TaxID=3827 RepID=UPI003CC6A5BB
MEGEHGKKMKILCLHGFRTSGSFIKKQISKWDPSIFSQFHMDFTKYTNLEECISYLTEYIIANGPFDGFLGFSQGATLSALLIGYQAQGKLLKEHPPIKFLVSISGSKFRDPSICDVAYKEPIKAKSVHFIGEKDWLKIPSEELASAFHKPLIIRHPQGHTVPRLDEVATGQLQNWVAEIISQPKVGVSICEDENKVEVDSTNHDKGVNGVEINKGNAETVEVA